MFCDWWSVANKLEACKPEEYAGEEDHAADHEEGAALTAFTKFVGET